MCVCGLAMLPVHVSLCFFILCCKTKAIDSGSGIGQNDSQPNAEDAEMMESDELRLFHDLMRHYDRDVRPMKNASLAVIVRLGITLTQIFDLDEKNQVLTTNVWLDMEWIDDYLTWDPGDYQQLKTIRIPCERIWLPDIVLYNNADDYTQGFMNSRAMVSHDGNVFWPPPTKMRSKCPVDVTYFPFDHQTCILKLGSWIYDGFQVDVTNRSDAVDMSNYVPNGEWELVETTIERNIKYYPCCPEPFPDVTITIVIRRRTLYYISNVVLPCMMMSALTLLVFRLPPDAGEKIALGFTVLLAFSVFMLTVAEKMPETSTSVPLIGMYLTSVMAITTLSIMMTVMVLNFHYRGPSKKEAPKWLKALLLGKVGHFFCADVVAPPISSQNFNRSRSTASRKRVSVGQLESAALKKSSAFWVDHDNSTTENDSCGHQTTNNLTVSSPRQPTKNNLQGSAGTPRTVEDIAGLLKLKAPTVDILSHHCTYHKDLLHILHCVMDKDEKDFWKAEAVNEWRQLAVIIDRILFWVFLVAIFVCSIAFLLVVPFHRKVLQL